MVEKQKTVDPGYVLETDLTERAGKLDVEGGGEIRGIRGDSVVSGSLTGLTCHC